MFAISARVVPAAALAANPPERCSTFTSEPSTLTSTAELTLSARLPFVPLIVTVCPWTSALTPLASSTGFFATLDIVVIRLLLGAYCSGSSEHDAEHFAAVAFRSRLDVRH